MDNEPNKGGEPVIRLSRDHHSAILFNWRIRNGVKRQVDPERIKAYIRYFWQYHLIPHFSQEESIVFAPVEPTLVQRAIDDHRQIAKLVSEIGNSKGNIGFMITQLADIIDAHIHHEERELFPQLEQILSLQQLKDIRKQLFDQYNPDLKDDFADEFWAAG